jgi:Holliday junction DNA helicase RuvA
MLDGLRGKLKRKDGSYVVVELGGLDLRVRVPTASEERLPPVGQSVALFTWLHWRQDGLELYGFLEEEERRLFQLLMSVGGVGPKSALAIVGAAPLNQLLAAIRGGQAEVLEKSSGIGHKLALRIILELKDKIGTAEDKEALDLLEADNEILEALVSLGYSKRQAGAAVRKIDPALKTSSDRLRDALKKIS